MIFPKGQALYENLNTSFTHLDVMLTELKSSQFTGYVQLTAWEYDGILLIDTGNIVNAVEQSKDQLRHGSSAADGIAVKGREKDGAISVYRVAPEMIQLLANLFDSEPLYKDLSSDLTTLDKLIGKLQNEKHTGYIEISMTKSKNVASIYLRDGQVVESAHTNNGSVSHPSKTLDEIVSQPSMSLPCSRFIALNWRMPTETASTLQIASPAKERSRCGVNDYRLKPIAFDSR